MKHCFYVQLPPANVLEFPENIHSLPVIVAICMSLIFEEKTHTGPLN